MLIVDQFQVHVHEERIKELRQLCPMAVQGALDEVFQAAVVLLVQRRVPLLVVSREHRAHVRLVLHNHRASDCKSTSQQQQLLRQSARASKQTAATTPWSGEQNTSCAHSAPRLNNAGESTLVQQSILSCSFLDFPCQLLST